MLEKQVFFSKAGREKLLNGINVLANAVKVTLGPMGRNVIIERGFGESLSTKDGVTVAKAIFLEDTVENMGAQIIKEVAVLTVNSAGDGTTTATVLAQSIITQGMDAINNGGNPVEIKKGIDAVVKQLVDVLKKISQPVDSLEQLKQVAYISTNNDKFLGDLVAESMHKVTKDGIITIEPSPKKEQTYFKQVDGLEFDRGYIHDGFINNSKGTGCELINPLILITDRKVSSFRDCSKYLEYGIQMGRPVLVIANEVDGEMLGSMIINMQNGKISSCAVRCPGYRDNTMDLLKDIAFATGAMIVSEQYGNTLATANPAEVMGGAYKVSVSKDKTTIITLEEHAKDIRERLEMLGAQKEEEDDEFRKEALNERMAMLRGGIGVIYVGGTSELEASEKKDRVDDAVNAVRSAMEEGIVPGGGAALIRAANGIWLEQGLEWGSIVLNACEAPMVQILRNSGYSESKITEVLAHVIKGQYENDFYGWNLMFNDGSDLKSAGIIDPTKVVRVALENAASVAGLLLTTECVISISKKSSDKIIEKYEHRN